ncbi:MAG: MarR family transcriptional regulator [Archangium sp.]|nr:MarR family transcriptional regulator [Archangium sp.]
MGRRREPLEVLQDMQARSLGFALIRCGQLFNERGMAKVNAEAGGPMLREAHTRLLPHLQDPKGVRITALARKLGVTKQAIQQLVADLLEAGVVEVLDDPDDARARLVVLTELGVNAMQHGTSLLLDIEKDLATRFGAQNTKRLHALLSELLTLLEGPDA